MLRWLRSPRPTWRPGRLLNLCLLLLLASAAAPLHAAGARVPAPAQQQPAQQSVPQTLNFVNNVAQVQSTANLNQNQIYLFFGTQGQNLQVQLSSTPSGANFELRGANNNVYKSFNDPTLNWSFTLPESQNYRITVNSSTPVFFTLVVTLGAGGTPQRLTFTPGQTLQQVTGAVGPGQSPQYIFTASAGQTLRVILFSTNGQGNFSVRGVLDNQIYKPDSNPSTDWQTVLAVNQDYLITVTSPTQTNFTLQVFLSGPQPGEAERITFNPGQSTTTRSGNLQPNVPKNYVFFADAGRTIRLLLTSQPAGSANFSVIGISDGITYKQATDTNREWSYPLTVSQDYLVTVFAGQAASYTLEVTVPTPLPPTISPTPSTPIPTVPAGCTNDTILNGSFEVDGFWIFGDSPVQPAYVSTVVRTPLRSMRLGIDAALGAGVQNQKAFSSIRQPFTIPATASIAQLRWWNFYRTEEGQTDSPGLAEDKQQVVLLNPDLSTVAVLRSVRRNTGAWQEEMVDLTPYRGRPLLLYFNVYNDGNGQRTWQYLDDVLIYACFPAVTATPFVPTPVPTMYPTLLPTFVVPTIIMPTVVVPTIIAPTIIAPTVIAPTVIAPTIIAPTIVAPTIIAPTAVAPTALPTLIAPTVAGDAFVPPTPAPTPAPTLANGEPVVIELPSLLPTIEIDVAVPVQIAAAPTVTPTPQPTVRPLALVAFDRPLNEVLIWGAVMLGALAVIGIIVALIWQASSRSGSRS